jgi:DNA-binding MarR family transcriptional regulator
MTESQTIPSNEGNLGPPGGNISRHLVRVSVAVRSRISNGLLERGHDMSVAVTHIVNNLPADGLGMSKLAERAGLSLQRAGQLVTDLETDGYVERVPDPDDGRARRVVYTRRGKCLLRDIEDMLEEANALLGEIVGEKRFEQLLLDLTKLDRALNANIDGIRVVIGETS